MRGEEGRPLGQEPEGKGTFRHSAKAGFVLVLY